MRILFLSTWFPLPQNNGSKLRVLGMLRRLAARHEVSLLSFSEARDTPNLEGVAGICQHVEAFPLSGFRPLSTRSVIGFVSQTPRSLVDTYSKQMASAIQRHIRGGCDAVIASQLPMLVYGPLLAGTPTLMEEIELATIYGRRASNNSLPMRLRAQLTRAKMDAFLARSTVYFRAYTVVSEQERRLLAHAIGERRPIEIIPNCVDFAQYCQVSTPRRPESLVFTGSLTFSPNRDAVQYFLANVFPLVKHEMPGAHITITGRAPDGLRMPELAIHGVQYLGHVPDVRPVVAASAVSVAPIRSGGGTRLKILEAMALGTPVVSTSKGAEGLDVVDGEHLLIGDTPKMFADQVVRLMRDEPLRRRLAANARDLVRNKYDWSVIMPRFLSLLEDVAKS